MKAVRGLLDEAGFDRTHYHEESFSFESLAAEAVPEATVQDAAPAESPDADAPQFSVSFAKTGREIACGAAQHVLDAARQAGVRLPASCTQGMCGTCKVRLVSGQVDMKHNGGIRQREIDQGMVLLCCSKPLSDLVIDK
jgi:3-phenylpropionate/trans-cinnamate dioxygenase ferredoxin reductase subunit